MRTMILTAMLVAVAFAAAPVSAQEVDECVGKPGMASACADNTSGATCVSAGFGLQGGMACAGRGGATVCTTMYTSLYGYCPTSLVG